LKENLWVIDVEKPENRDGAELNSAPFGIRGGISSFSPSGDSLAYINSSEHRQLIRKLDSSGTIKTLTSDECAIDKLQYNPKIPRIAYILCGRIWSMDDNGYNKEALTGSTDWNGQVMRIQWSPDGSRIACLDVNQVWVMDADGSNRLRVSPFYDIDSGGALSWSPDGKWISLSFTKQFDSSNYGISSGINVTGRNALMGKGIIVLLNVEKKQEAEVHNTITPGTNTTKTNINVTKDTGTKIPGTDMVSALLRCFGVVSFTQMKR
jgi:Tol biopolymer transport system component